MRIRLILLLCLVSTAGLAKDITPPKGFLKLDQRSAPHFTLKDIDGVSYTYANSSGKWAFIHFWASWCGPCRKEIPELERLIKTDIAKKIDIIIINTGENEDTIFGFLSEFAPDLHTVMDSDGLITEKYSPRGLPTTYLVSPEGKMIYLALGGIHWTEPLYYNFLQKLVKHH